MKVIFFLVYGKDFKISRFLVQHCHIQHICKQYRQMTNTCHISRECVVWFWYGYSLSLWEIVHKLYDLPDSHKMAKSTKNVFTKLLLTNKPLHGTKSIFRLQVHLGPSWKRLQFNIGCQIADRFRHRIGFRWLSISQCCADVTVM